MAFFGYARCDNPVCGDVLQVADDEELRDYAWTTVELGEDKFDFCSLTCLTAWGGSAEAVELVQNLAESPREDE